jgi:hypothetical protein
MQLDAVGQALQVRAAEVQLVELFRACSQIDGIKINIKKKRKGYRGGRGGGGWWEVGREDKR